MSSIRADIAAAEAAIDAAVDAIAERIFNEVVKPYCDRTGREFSSGMGSWSFHKGGRQWGGWDGHKGLPRNLVDLLSAPIPGNGRTQDIGSYVDSYKP